MSYVAMKRFSNTPAGTEDQTDYEPGDPVPDFQTWPEHARTVLLRQNFVQPHFDGPPLTEAIVDDGPGEAAAPRRGPGRPRK